MVTTAWRALNPAKLGLGAQLGRDEDERPRPAEDQASGQPVVLRPDARAEGGLGLVVEIVGHHFGDLDGFLSAEAAAVLVIEGDRPVTGGGNAGDIRAENFDPVPFRQPRDGVVLEAVNPGGSQVGRHAQIARGPNAAPDPVARLEHQDIVSVDAEIPALIFEQCLRKAHDRAPVMVYKIACSCLQIFKREIALPFLSM